MPGSLYSSANLLLSVICRFYLTLRYTVFDVVDVEKATGCPCFLHHAVD